MGGQGGQTAPPDTKNREGEQKIGKGKKKEKRGKGREKRKGKEEEREKEKTRHDCVIAMTRILPAYAVTPSDSMVT